MNSHFFLFWYFYSAFIVLVHLYICRVYFDYGLWFPKWLIFDAKFFLLYQPGELWKFFFCCKMCLENINDCAKQTAIKNANCISISIQIVCIGWNEHDIRWIRGCWRDIEKLNDNKADLETLKQQHKYKIITTKSLYFVICVCVCSIGIISFPHIHTYRRLGIHIRSVHKKYTWTLVRRVFVEWHQYQTAIDRG